MNEAPFANESAVRSYCRRLPNVLAWAKGASVTDVDGNEFIDFLSACGALNYGHNHPRLKEAAIRFIEKDGIAAALDFYTDSKLSFMRGFEEVILKPRGMKYRLQFPGPTGTNCVEAALKLAKKVTGKNGIVAFTNAFHGVSAGALAVTASEFARKSAGPGLGSAIRLPFDGYEGAGIAELKRFEAMALDPSGGIEPVAAFIVETVQGEGGLNVASSEWLRALASTAVRLGALLIVDDIQAGCGRTGTFFSFERADISPDLVCMAKSISGYGFPMSLLLIAPEHDKWSPGEHNGTFRGNSVAFATASAAIDLWTEGFESVVVQRSRLLSKWCDEMRSEFSPNVRPKGIGMMQGLGFSDPLISTSVADTAAREGIIIECCGPRDEVLKVFAPLNIEMDEFRSGLDRLHAIIRRTIETSGSLHQEPRVLDVAARTEAVTLERDEASLDPHDHRCDAIGRAELPHGIS